MLYWVCFIISQWIKSEFAVFIQFFRLTDKCLYKKLKVKCKNQYCRKPMAEGISDAAVQQRCNEKNCRVLYTQSHRWPPVGEIQYLVELLFKYLFIGKRPAVQEMFPFLHQTKAQPAFAEENENVDWFLILHSVFGQQSGNATTYSGNT